MSDSPLLPCVELHPPNGGEATSAVIWLHGLGADGNDFVPIVPELGLPEGHGIRFVFPHAPKIPVTLNGGFVMPAWYDITSLDARGQDEAGIRKSSNELERLIDREVGRGIPTERIVLAGFSQGGAIALFCGLRLDLKLAGIMALSTYLVAPDVLETERHEANAKTPIFQAHGTFDPMVPHSLAIRTREWLEGHDYEVESLDYPMAHQVCLEEIEAIGNWLRRILV